MGRAPCCEKMGLKKGPWTPEEDRILISYIQQYGHSNWRALPKEAGLLRCGKSCRLRWVNYLKPDIKRGNFTYEEEEALFKLHEMLGNRWSAIAARLPGRTDNEIKNVWHTHLKKRLNNVQKVKEKTEKRKRNVMNKPEFLKNDEEPSFSQVESPQQSNTTTDVSSTMEDSSMQSLPEIDESFWTENLSIDDFEIASMIEDVDQLEKFGFEERVEDGEIDFWYNVFIQTGGSVELPEF